MIINNLKLKYMQSDSKEPQGNEANTLLGTVLTKSITFKIEIRSIDKPVPEGELENLKEWLKHKAIELGSGLQFDHYGYTKNYKDDIGLGFYVYSA